MTKFLKVSAIAAGLLFAGSALASVQFDPIAPVVFDNGSGWESSVDGNAGDTFRVKAVFDVTADSDVNAVSIDRIGDFLPKECHQFQEVTQSVTGYTTEFDSNFSVSVGSAPYEVKLYGVQNAGQDFNCSNSNVLDTYMLPVNRIITNIGDTNSAGSTGGSGTGTTVTVPPWQSQFDQLALLISNLTKQVQALASSTQATTGTTVGAPSALCSMLPPSTNVYGLQTFLMNNGQSQIFTSHGVYAATGYLGPITLQALTNFQFANNCPR